MSKVGDIIDIAFDQGLFAPNVTKGTEWDGSQIYMITFGQAAYRKTLTIPASLSLPEISSRMAVAANVSPHLEQRALRAKMVENGVGTK